MVGSTRPNRPKVFISYSHSDKEFARQLDASLLANNVETFLDDREIKIGESIPRKIYDWISSSSHLIYVVSAASVNSSYARDELDAAKTKANSSEDFRILPLLIDKVEPPPAISHIKYADFTDWRDPNAYRREFLELLRAMGVEPRLVGREEVNWYAKNWAQVRRLHRSFSNIAGNLSGALDATQVAQDSHRNAHSITVNWAVMDEGLIDNLVLCRDVLLKDVGGDGKSRLDALRRAVEAALNYAQENSLYANRQDFGVVLQFLPLLRRVVNMLDEIRGEVETVLLSPITAV